jgi:hypothetical protein
MNAGHAHAAHDWATQRPLAVGYRGTAAGCDSATHPTAARKCPIWLAVGLALACWSAATPLHAEVVDSKTAQGYTVTVERPWHSTTTYQPLWITIAPLVAPAAPRRMTIEVLWHRDDYRAPVLLRSERSIDIRAEDGTSPRSTTVLVPLVEGYYGGELRVRFREDNTLLQALDVRFPLYESQMVPTAVFVTTQPKSGVQRQFGEAMGIPLLADVSRIEVLAVLSPTRLPEQWIELSGVDTVWISLEDLRQLAQSDEPRFRALRAWTAAGGVLLVHGLRHSPAAGSQPAVPDPDDLRELEQLLEMAEPGQTTGGSQGAWQTLSLDARPYGVPDDYYDAEREYDLESGPVPMPVSPPVEPRAGNAVSPPRSLHAHRLELGTVVAVVGPPWKMYQDLMQQRYLSGVSGDVAQRYGGRPPWIADFEEFLVPGVGRPPVAMFQVLITLFVIGIGPVNYLLLRRKKKLYLMLVTVPAIALAVTVGLLGYAALSDGFAVRVRARTFTSIDQTPATPRAVSFARLSYYAGLAPGDGLRFPTDTVVLSFDSADNVYRDRLPGERRIAWGRDQHLASGWLDSRSPMQLVTARSRQTPARLRIQPAAEDGTPPAVTNELGAHLHYLLVCDAQGKLLAAEQLSPGQSTALRADNVQAVCAAMLQRTSEASSGLSGAASPTAVPYPFGRDGLAYPEYAYAKPLMGDGALEPCLQRALRAARQQMAQPTRMAPRTYIAIVDKSPEVEFGVREVRQVSSLHVIVGRW